MHPSILPGQSYPLGATVVSGGVNFCVYSRSGTGVELLLFDHAGAAQPTRVIPLSPDRQHRTFHYWHAFVPELNAGQIYAYQVYGPDEPESGHRFDPTKLLIDPYARAVAVPPHYDRKAGHGKGDNAATAMKSVVADLSTYDWRGDTPPRHPFSRTVIYELHVGGFTKHASSQVHPLQRGTFAGLIEKIPYLQSLGITAVELLPIFQFDPQESPPGLVNYWGYNPMSFFALHSGYSSVDCPLAALDEFRDLVRALHAAGIEVLLDVVYNHTAEGDAQGPTFCFKGFENRDYYILGEDAADYANFSGTGNTLNANHSVVRRLILDSLRYWVQEMHVDGFRFDLAAVLSRDTNGRPLARPPILWDIETDPVLSGTKLIAEAWDAAGLYQVGSFFGDHWKEWNGHFRDDVRAFVRGDRGFAGKLASRFLASPDIYGHRDREPEQSINFVTCHDGFTLNDLVSYNAKHNAANHEGNRDGHNHNLSWNCGVEGPSNDPQIEQLRLQQIKNFFTINLLALGVPMLLMGDELRRSQQGNNNAYCQDNELSWLDWSGHEKHAGLWRFVQGVIHLRQSLPERSPTSLAELLTQAQLTWHGVRLEAPDWSDDSHVVAFTVRGRYQRYHIVLNAYWKDLDFELPPREADEPWRRVIDTSQASPGDFLAPDAAPAISNHAITVAARSTVVLLAKLPRSG